jgi:hypothetical protein
MMQRILLGLATVLAAIGIGASLWHPTVSTVQISGASIAAPASTIAQAGELREADVIVQGNIFSPTRSAPRTRYSPNGDGDVEDSAATTEMTATTPDAASSGVPALFGTMIGPEGAQALLQLDAAQTEPRLYRVNERAGGYRVVRIEEREVTLSGPRGRVVLRLPVRPDEERK